MVNLDFAISAGIWVTGLGMSAIGIEMTIRPPTEEHKQRKWVYRGLFVFLGLAFIALNGWQFVRNDQAEQRRQDDHTQEQIRNEGDLKYMQGQLDSMNKVLGNLSANSDPRQVVSALRSVLLTAQNERPALQKMSNKKLRDVVIAFANQLRGLNARYGRQEEASSAQWMQDGSNIRHGATQPKPEQMQAEQQAFQSMIQRDTAISNQFQLDYKQSFAVDAVSYRDELIRRLGPQPPPDQNSQIHIPMSLSGWIAPQSVDATAFYLETLAKKLSD